MRVLVVASKYLPEYTGASLRIHALYRHLSGKGISPGVLCGGMERQTAERYALDGIGIERIGSSWAGAGRAAYWADALRGLAALRRRSFDVLHIIGSGPVTAAARHYAALTGTPCVVELVNTCHTVELGLPVLGKIWKPRFRKRVAVVAISEHLRAQAAREGYGDCTWTRFNPVDTGRFFRDPAVKMKLRRELTPFGDGDTVLCMVAKFMPQKNQAFLMNVMDRLPERYKMVLAGPLVQEGPLAARDRAYFETLAARAGPRVFLHPGFADSAAFMRASDIYAMPNTEEGLGTPMLEAMACGLPVVANAGEVAFRDIAARFPGAPVALEPLDPARWAEAIQAPFDEKSCEAAARAVAGRCAFTATADFYERLLKALTDRAGPDHINVPRLLSPDGPDAS